MSTLTLEITPETYHKLSEYALHTGKTIDRLGRELIETALDARPLPETESVRDILQRHGRIRPLGQTLRQKIQPDVALTDVRQALNQAAGPALSEIILAQRGAKT